MKEKRKEGRLPRVLTQGRAKREAPTGLDLRKKREDQAKRGRKCCRAGEGQFLGKKKKEGGVIRDGRARGGWRIGIPETTILSGGGEERGKSRVLRRAPASRTKQLLKIARLCRSEGRRSRKTTSFGKSSGEGTRPRPPSWDQNSNFQTRSKSPDRSRQQRKKDGKAKLSNQKSSREPTRKKAPYKAQTATV